MPGSRLACKQLLLPYGLLGLKAILKEKMGLCGCESQVSAAPPAKQPSRTEGLIRRGNPTSAAQAEGEVG